MAYIQALVSDIKDGLYPGFCQRHKAVMPWSGSLGTGEAVCFLREVFVLHSHTGSLQGIR